MKKPTNEKKKSAESISRESLEAKSSKSLSRRGFLKGALTVAGAGGAGLIGCATMTETGTKTAGKSSMVKDNKAEKHLNAKPLPNLSAPEKWDYQTDIVVAGGGGAGLAAAVSATENGAKVILLEKNPFCGGDTSIAEIAGGLIGSRFQSRFGIKAPPVGARIMAEGSQNPDGMQNIVTPNATAGRNATFLRQIMEQQKDTIDWLEDMGVVYSPEVGVGGLPVPGLGHVPIDPEHPEEGWYRWHPHNARGFTEALEKRAKAIGVKILKEHPATGLVTSGKHVIGIAARNIDGKTVYVKAKAVILATGGFGANTDMLKSYCSPKRAEAARYWGMPGATGDGLRMAQALGADLCGMDEIEIWDGGALREHGATTVYSAPNQLVRQKSLTVNKKAKRFFCESVYRGHVYSYQGAQTIAQPDMESFTLFDANTISKEDIIKKFHPLFCEYPCPWFEEQFKQYVAKGVIKKADTISELAKKLSIDPNALVKTVDRYNSLCDAGYDADFFKEPIYMHPIRTAPFYAVGQKGGSCFNTHGGLVVDENFHVLDKKWDPIPGLFVAGENAAGGGSVGFVLPGGRLAGMFAAKEVLG
ncbi:MAG: FAD-dependent oxidoreductase [Proteobacteria bacterium]|nr:FAD-dependent oxidoreductase [Pseudomonadota bacterium]